MALTGMAQYHTKTTIVSTFLKRYVHFYKTKNRLIETIDPLSEGDCFGIDIYLLTIDFVTTCIAKYVVN